MSPFLSIYNSHSKYKYIKKYETYRQIMESKNSFFNFIRLSKLGFFLRGPRSGLSINACIQMSYGSGGEVHFKLCCDNIIFTDTHRPPHTFFYRHVKCFAPTSFRYTFIHVLLILIVFNS